MSDQDLREFFPSHRDRVYEGDAVPVMCPGCGWNLPTSDGYCLDCAPPSYDDDDEFEDGYA